MLHERAIKRCAKEARMARPARFSSLPALSRAALLLLTLGFPLLPAASAMEAVDFPQAVARALSNNALVSVAGGEAPPPRADGAPCPRPPPPPRRVGGKM